MFDMTWVSFTGAALLPVVVTAVLYLAETRTRISKTSSMFRQIIAGIVMGVVAICGTEFGVPIEGATINVRDAAPVCAGLIFGPWAGVIAGVIGGVERWFATLWGRGEFTRVACTIATMMAGVYSALIRKYLLENRRANWFLALATGVVAEVFHLMLVFMTNMDEVEKAYGVVSRCTLPMIAGVGAACFLSAYIVACLAGQKRPKGTVRGIASTIQMGMFVDTVAVFIISVIFIGILQGSIVRVSAYNTLAGEANDVQADVTDASNREILNSARVVAAWVASDGDTSSERLATIAEDLELAEVNYVNSDGIIESSSDLSIVGFDMSSGEQAAEFLDLLHGKSEYVQEFRAQTNDSDVYRKYAGVATAKGFIQIGYDAEQFGSDIADQVRTAILNRHVGNSGYLLIFDSDDKLVASSADTTIGEEQINTLQQVLDANEDDEVVELKLGSTKMLGLYEWCEGFRICALLPMSEAHFTGNVSVLLTAFIEVIAFATVFLVIYILIRNLVVQNIRKVNSSLAQIIDGNLDTTVDVHDSAEFASLSDDINSTVVTLKHYISEAEARIDRELEYARQIQLSALPRVFPPFPDRTDFDIFASMDAAKEVGGDFYDFYLIDDTHLALTIADVSGKGIPASLFMMTSMTMLRGFAGLGSKPSEILAKANDSLAQNNDAGMFVTCWLGIVDLETGHVDFANAGHEIPAVWRAGSEGFEYIEQTSDFVLAGMEGMPYVDQEFDLGPGDTLYVYTDGVPEATNSQEELFGMDRLRGSLNAHKDGTIEDLCHGMYDDVMSFTGDAEQFDDVTMIAFLYLGPDAQAAFEARSGGSAK